MTIGDNIKKARKNAGLTQKELGKKMGVTAATISAFENDKTNIKSATLEKIAAALNIPVYELWDDDFLRMLEKIYPEASDERLFMSAAEKLLQISWRKEGIIKNNDCVEITFLDIEGVFVCVNDTIVREFDMNEFFNFMRDVLSYFNFKLCELNSKA